MVQFLLSGMFSDSNDNRFLLQFRNLADSSRESLISCVRKSDHVSILDRLRVKVYRRCVTKVRATVKMVESDSDKLGACMRPAKTTKNKVTIATILRLPSFLLLWW